MDKNAAPQPRESSSSSGVVRNDETTPKADEAKKASDDTGAKAGSSDLAKDAGAIASTSAIASTKRKFAPNIKKAMPASGRKRQTRSAETTASDLAGKEQARQLVRTAEMHKLQRDARRRQTEREQLTGIRLQRPRPQHQRPSCPTTENDDDKDAAEER